jgi:hypothetical protein
LAVAVAAEVWYSAAVHRVTGKQTASVDEVAAVIA